MEEKHPLMEITNELRKQTETLTQIADALTVLADKNTANERPEDVFGHWSERLQSS